MSSPPKISKLTLFSVLPVQALLSNLDAGFIADPADKNALCNIWQKANDAYRNTFASRSFIEQADMQPITNIEKSKIDRVLARIKLYSPYDSHQTNLYNVRISKLVTPQVTINISRAEKRTHLKKEMSPDELFDLSFEASGVSPETIITQTLGIAPNGGALLFTSYNEDIRLHHPPQHRQMPVNEKDPQSPLFETVCMPVGGGAPFASAFRIQISPAMTRLILNNGIHRAYKLAEAGYEWCPLAVTDLIPLEFPDRFVDMPKAMLLDLNSNPPLLIDFLNKDVVVPLNYFTVLKTIRLNWNFEEYVTVLK